MAERNPGRLQRPMVVKSKRSSEYAIGENLLISKSLQDEVSRRDVIRGVDDPSKVDSNQATDGIGLWTGDGKVTASHLGNGCPIIE